MTQLRSKTVELRRLYEDLLSSLGGSCGLPRFPLGPGEDMPLPPPPPPASVF
jgi:hypothetical protein